MTHDSTIWVNILHWYQPPTIEAETLKVVVEESYRPLLAFLQEHSQYHLTININSCLTYLLYEHGHEDIIQNLKQLIHSGQVELIDTAAYHPILPLLSEQEVRKQVIINQDMNRGFFELTDELQPRGFFLPECAYSSEVAAVIAQMGYEWILLDEIAYNGTLQHIDPAKKYEIENLGLAVVFRNRTFSKSYVPDHIQQLLTKKNLPSHIVTATDAELYGHRHKDIHHNLRKTINDPRITTLTASAYLDSLSEITTTNPVASNWDAEEKDLQDNLPYSLWYNPNNKIQNKLWSLAENAYELVEAREDAPDYWWARLHLERGLSSCTFWWASGKDFKLFSGPAWKPDEIEKGANQLIKAIRSLSVDKEVKLRAEKQYLEILHDIWHKHWETNT